MSTPTLPRPAPPTPELWYKKLRYHHGNLRSSALARGRQIVRLHGPSALTLRGLARDLGVSATSVVRQFGNLPGLRCAVAEAALELLKTQVGLAPRSKVGVEDVAGRWVAFAAAQPNLYRLVAGEGWHAPGIGTRGIHGLFAVPSPLRTLEGAIRWRGEPGRACSLASTIHGLALARIDGVAAASVDTALARALHPVRTPAS